MTGRDIHWTEDTSLLERFVLRAIPGAERELLEHHLRTCEICQRAVREEQRLVLGIRRAGREDLKERLRTRLARPTGRDIPWPRILSLAATIVIVLGVGIYNGWFGAQKDEQHRFADEVQTLSPSAPGDQPAVATEEREQPQQEETVRKDRSTGISSVEGGEFARKRQEEKRSQLNRKSEPTADKADNEFAASAQDDRIVAGIKKEKSEFAPSGLESVGAITQSEWVEGTVLDSEPQSAHEPARTEQDANLNQYAPMSRERGKAGAMTAPAQVFNGQAIVLNQQSSSTLPLSLQNARRSQTIETQVQTFNQTLNLTLYLDSLVDESELRNAVVEQVSRDSLIVRIANQRIGYRIPAGLNTQTRTR